MNQLSLFDLDENEAMIYEALETNDLFYEIEKYKLIKIYEENGYTCYVKTKCGRLIQLFVSTVMKDLHSIVTTFSNLRDSYIDKVLSRIEVEYF